jgi:hypothetical protein
LAGGDETAAAAGGDGGPHRISHVVMAAAVEAVVSGDIWRLKNKNRVKAVLYGNILMQFADVLIKTIQGGAATLII